jgi:membrane protease YdiL (CAAX protease family)
LSAKKDKRMHNDAALLKTRLSLINLLAVVAPVAAAAVYFVLGKALWAVIGVGVVAAAGLFLQHLRKPFGLSNVVFVFLVVNFLIGQLGIEYPYTNILVLAGLIGLFFLTEMEWSGLFFLPGSSAKWMRQALALGVLLGCIILLTVRFVPSALPVNPVPKGWPIDVVMVMALGYATFSALMEETIFRSLMVAFAAPFLSLPVAVAMQALLFGLMHYRLGVPVGLPGVVVGSLWGLAAGWLVLKAGSIYPAYVMHFVLVLVVFVGLVFLAS